MSREGVLKIDFTQKGASEQIFSESPRLTSHHSDWSAFYVEHHCQPYIDVPELHHVAHTVACFLGSSLSSERWLDSHYQNELQIRGGVSILPAGVSHRFITSHACEFIILTLDPTYLDQVAQEWEKGDLIPHFATQQDPLNPPT